MSRRVANRVFNVGLRGVALSAKFVLIFSLARFLEPSDVGLYGLVFVTVTYSQFVLGMGFYTYANRELIGAERHRWSTLLRDQGIFHLFTYVFVLPLCLLLFFFEVLPWNVALWFFVLLILEHLALELGRILIAMSQQVLATLMLFLRAGAWVLILIPAMWFEPGLRTLESVFIAWSIGTSLACVIGLHKVLSAERWDRSPAVDWKWLARGFCVAAPLLVATLALKGLTTFDRYWVEAIGGLEVLAAYVLFVGVCNGVKAFLDSGVFVYMYPGLIRAAHRGDERAFRAGMRSMAWQTIVVTVGLTTIALVFVQPLLKWIDRPIYGEHIVLLYWALGAAFLYAAGMVFHYGIYAHRKDSAIIISHLAGLSVFTLSVVLLNEPLGVVAVPMSMCLAYALILVWKAFAFTRIQFICRDALALNYS